jgi:tripartite-type tricarboxylate transporter receptor subunit TctC
MKNIFISILVLFFSVNSFAQDSYPNKKTITIVSPFIAGGGSDILTRILAESFQKTLGTQVVVSNVAGAGGTIGSSQVARAAPDGLTLLLVHIGMSTAPALYKNLPFDPIKSFEHIGLFAEAPKLLLAGKHITSKDGNELIDYLKKSKEQINFATAGIGSAGHLCALLLEESLGVRFTQIQYKGGSAAMVDVIGGRSDFFCEIPPPIYQHIKAGNLKAYMHASENRMASLPDVPTAKELGLGQFKMSVWYGLYAPLGTPKLIVEKLSTALQGAIKDPAVQSEAEKLGLYLFPPYQATPQALRKHLQSQMDLWTPIIKKASLSQ